MPDPVVDVHTHIFCWGEDPREGWVNPKTRRHFTTRLLIWATRIHREPGATLTEKIRSLMIRRIEASILDKVVVLAEDARYREDGSRADAETPFYVSNDYVLDLAKRCAKVIPGPSINPWRPDALAELDRVRKAGARLVKVHTAIQGVDPALKRFDPFYRRAGELGIVLMFHTGYEHSSPVVSQSFTDPARLGRVLDHGHPVIAAHSGTCAFFDPNDYYPNFVRMMKRYPNLYGDTSILATTPRLLALNRLGRAPAWLKARLLHGSDHPFPPGRMPFLVRTGLFPRERVNPLDFDLKIKRGYAFGEGYESRAWDLLTR